MAYDGVQAPRPGPGLPEVRLRPLRGTASGTGGAHPPARWRVVRGGRIRTRRDPGQPRRVRGDPAEALGAAVGALDAPPGAC
jgi:hypothetical protein